MKKTKVLIFNPKITNGGISKIVSDYIRFMDDDICVELMTLKNENNIYYKDLNIKIYEVSLSKNIFKRIYNEYKIIKKSNPDVIHINGDYISRIIECISAKLANVKKIIIHSHNNGVGENKLIKKYTQLIFKKSFDFLATDYFSCSKSAAKWMFSNKIYKENKYEIINNGIDINKFKYNEKIRNKIRKKYNLEDKYVIGFIGRLSYQKNPLFLLDIFNECKKANNDSFLIIIGTGELENDVLNKIKEYKLSDSVLLLKNIDNVNEYYNAMDCFVLPSYYEGLGIVNIESQTSGIKTIVSDKVPKETQISDLITYISLNEKISVWVENILSINFEKRKNAYKNTKEYGYDIKSVVEKLENIYKEK